MDDAQQRQHDQPGADAQSQPGVLGGFDTDHQHPGGGDEDQRHQQRTGTDQVGQPEVDAGSDGTADVEPGRPGHDDRQGEGTESRTVVASADTHGVIVGRRLFRLFRLIGHGILASLLTCRPCRSCRPCLVLPLALTGTLGALLLRRTLQHRGRLVIGRGRTVVVAATVGDRQAACHGSHATRHPAEHRTQR